MCPKTLRARHYHSPASTALFQAATKQLCLNAADTPCPMLKPSGWLQRGVVHSKKSSYTPQKKSEKNPENSRIFLGFKILGILNWERKNPRIQFINPFFKNKILVCQKKIMKNPKNNPENPEKIQKIQGFLEDLRSLVYLFGSVKLLQFNV